MKTLRTATLFASAILTSTIATVAMSIEPGLQRSAPSANVQTEKKIHKEAIKLAGVLPKVTHPTMSHQVGFEGTKFKLTIRFNTDMDRSSVIAGGTLMINFPKAANANGTIHWNSDRELTWTHQSPSRFSLCIYDPDCEFELILKDNIRSKQGINLDGDNDNKPGGNFSLWMIDLG